ncbi:hypothetical protein GCM10025859_08670 [Alicyclobacillus fastidiosus]|nr:hypothetical protein GCM10025859_08670 [Alicyclobacillus fastidiosus]
MNKPRFQSDKYHFAFLDEASKREIRRATLKAISIPGYQVPFASREMPIGRGWGTGGLQLTLSLIGREDTVKVIDQGNDESVNAVSIRKLIEETSGIATTTDTTKATLIQTRHRIPEEELREDQILVFQVPQPEPLRRVDAKEMGTKRKHSEMDYSGIWLTLYEDIVRWGRSPSVRIIHVWFTIATYSIRVPSRAGTRRGSIRAGRCTCSVLVVKRRFMRFHPLRM